MTDRWQWHLGMTAGAVLAVAAHYEMFGWRYSWGFELAGLLIALACAYVIGPVEPPNGPKHIA